MKPRMFRVASSLPTAVAIALTAPFALAQASNVPQPQQEPQTTQPQTEEPQTAQPQTVQPQVDQDWSTSEAWRSAHEGLVGAALHLPSLTSAQRSAIEQIAQQRRSTDVGVKQADALVMRMLAQQVEQGTIKPQLLQPGIGAEQSAAAARSTVDANTLNQLHAILTADQRDELIDRVESRIAQMQQQHSEEPFQGPLTQQLQLTPDQSTQIRANLQAQGTPRTGAAEAQGRMTTFFDAFRGDSFDATQFARVRAPGEHLERLVQAMMPVLTTQQRAVLAAQLRKAAARSST